MLKSQIFVKCVCWNKCISDIQRRLSLIDVSHKGHKIFNVHKKEFWSFFYSGQPSSFSNTFPFLPMNDNNKFFPKNSFYFLYRILSYYWKESSIVFQFPPPPGVPSKKGPNFFQRFNYFMTFEKQIQWTWVYNAAFCVCDLL